MGELGFGCICFRYVGTLEIKKAIDSSLKRQELKQDSHHPLELNKTLTKLRLGFLRETLRLVLEHR